jgi:hypothetical protein
MAGNHLLAVTANRDQLVPGRTSSAVALRSVFAPQFFQVLPRLDLTVPIGVGYNVIGLSEVIPEMNRGTGDVGIGLSATLDQSWTATLNLTHYFGASKIPFLYAANACPRMSQWDYVAMTVQHSF